MRINRPNRWLFVLTPLWSSSYYAWSSLLCVLNSLGVSSSSSSHIDMKKRRTTQQKLLNERSKKKCPFKRKRRSITGSSLRKKSCATTTRRSSRTTPFLYPTDSSVCPCSCPSTSISWWEVEEHRQRYDHMVRRGKYKKVSYEEGEEQCNRIVPDAGT